MKIVDLVCARGRTGFYFDDQRAIKQGAKADGSTYTGTPVTPGFTSVRQAGEAISVMLILEDGQIAHGDCAAVQYSGRVVSEARAAFEMAAQFAAFLHQRRKLLHVGFGKRAALGGGRREGLRIFARLAEELQPGLIRAVSGRQRRQVLRSGGGKRRNAAQQQRVLPGAGGDQRFGKIGLEVCQRVERAVIGAFAPRADSNLSSLRGLKLPERKRGGRRQRD